MGFVSLFSSSQFISIADNIIATAIFDSRQPDAGNLDSTFIKNSFYACISESAKKILKSDQTKEKLLKKLQEKRLLSAFRDLASEGIALPANYFEERFSRVISKRNAKKIAPVFLELFRAAIAAHPEQATALGHRYRNIISRGQWGLEAADIDWINVLLLEGGNLPETSPEPVSEDAAEITAIPLPANSDSADGNAAEDAALHTEDHQETVEIPLTDAAAEAGDAVSDIPDDNADTIESPDESTPETIEMPTSNFELDNDEPSDEADSYDLETVEIQVAPDEITPETSDPAKNETENIAENSEGEPGISETTEAEDPAETENTVRDDMQNILPGEDIDFLAAPEVDLPEIEAGSDSIMENTAEAQDAPELEDIIDVLAEADKEDLVGGDEAENEVPPSAEAPDSETADSEPSPESGTESAEDEAEDPWQDPLIIESSIPMEKFDEGADDYDPTTTENGYHPSGGITFPVHQFDRHQGTATSVQAPPQLQAIHFKQPGSGQLCAWDPSWMGLPVRGLRKIEGCMNAQPLLYISGEAACGKSALVSAYVHHLISNDLLEEKRIFYYRFVPEVSDSEAFNKALVQFLKKQGVERNTTEIVQDFSEAMALTGALFILDDLDAALDNDIQEQIAGIWNNLAEMEDFKGKLLLVSQEKPDNYQLSDATHYLYEGLSVSESGALLRDVWKLKLPRMIARELSRKLRGNPLIMGMVKIWLENETHTDSALERFTENIPDDHQELWQYVGKYLFDSFERNDSRYNHFLRTISLFGIPENEIFLETAYGKVGGGEFQDLLEQCVDRYHLVQYDFNLDRYNIQPALASIYSETFENLQIKRILHFSIGQLYEERFHKGLHLFDAIEGIRHYLMSEREAPAAELLKPAMDLGSSEPRYVHMLIGLGRRVQIDLLEEERRIDLLLQRGIFYFNQNVVQDAERDLKMCGSMSPSDPQKAALLYYLGLICQSKIELDVAVQYLQNALSIYTLLEDQRGIANSATKLADIYIIQKDTDAAYDMLVKAQQIYEEIGDLFGTVHCYQSIGHIFKSREDWSRAFSMYSKSQEIYEKVGDQRGVGQALSNIGLIHEHLGEIDKAVQVIEQEIKLKKRLEDWMGVAKAYEKVGNIYRGKEDWEQALACYEASEKIFNESNNTYGLASVYDNIGLVNQHREEWDSAMALYQKSLELHERNEDVAGIARAYERIAGTYRARGEFDRAMDMFEQVLNIQEKTEQQEGIADTYENIGDVYVDQEQHQFAIEIYLRAIQMKEATGHEVGAAVVYSKIGNIYQDDKNWELALSNYEQALEMFSKSNELSGCAQVFQSLGSIFQAREEWQNALQYLEKALTIYLEIGAHGGAARTHYLMGNIYHDLAEWDPALEHYKAALPLFETVGDLYSMAQTLGNISSIEFELQDYAGAIFRQVEILLYFQKFSQNELVERVLGNLVACHQDLGPDTFQPVLTECLEKISDSGVTWGEHEILAKEKASQVIAKIFYNA